MVVEWFDKRTKEWMSTTWYNVEIARSERPGEIYRTAGTTQEVEFSWFGEWLTSGYDNIEVARFKLPANEYRLKPEHICTMPPIGWVCTRAAGHDGPCAAKAVGILSSLPGTYTEPIVWESGLENDTTGYEEDDDELWGDEYDNEPDLYDTADIDDDDEIPVDETDFSGISVAVTSEDEIVLNTPWADEITLTEYEVEDLIEKLSWGLFTYRASQERVPF